MPGQIVDTSFKVVRLTCFFFCSFCFWGTLGLVEKITRDAAPGLNVPARVIYGSYGWMAVRIAKDIYVFHLKPMPVDWIKGKTV